MDEFEKQKVFVILILKEGGPGSDRLKRAEEERREMGKMEERRGQLSAGSIQT